jgi:hypothetical protein
MARCVSAPTEFCIINTGPGPRSLTFTWEILLQRGAVKCPLAFFEGCSGSTVCSNETNEWAIQGSRQLKWGKIAIMAHPGTFPSQLALQTLNSKNSFWEQGCSLIEHFPGFSGMLEPDSALHGWWTWSILNVQSKWGGAEYHTVTFPSKENGADD